MDTIELLAELRAARQALTGEHRAELAAAGIPRAIVDHYPLIGAALVRVARGLYEPASDGLPAYITPILIASPVSPETPHPLVYARHLGECVDLAAWHPAHPTQWALRTGIATWLGCIEPQYMDPEPVRICRSPLTWLRAGCEGLVVLGDAADAYRLLCGCQRIAAEDNEHAAELRRMVRRPWPLPTITELRDAA